MAKLNLTSRVRAGMALERQSAEARLQKNAVAETALREAATVVGVRPVHGDDVATMVPRQRIKIADTVSNPYNPRTFYSAETIDGLARSLEEDGQLEPIKVTRLSEYPGKWVIIDGERRLRAAKSRGAEFIDAELHEERLENKALYLRAYRANKERDAQTVFDDAIAWNRLLEKGIYRDYSELAAAVNEAPTHVNKVILLNSLPPSFLSRMAQSADTVGLAHAYNLKLILERGGLAVAEHWLQEILEGRASVRRLEQAASADAPTRRGGSRRVHYQSRVQFKRRDGGSLGELKLFADGRTELSLQGVDGESQQMLAERMKALIESWTRELDGEASA
ncbi:parB-like partition protein [Caballeronia temeraria]|uniref:ParB-like partition protein n=1 Tax=Caballeronia temeraria TaxID=1777137 RepID=A0A158DVN9_9BURK|nr:ParB/RepB/Spo0J family partition protein [Caballeronia temeraria]SAK98648.1 parB-like partition protein [Caballeronia temeraria]